MRADHRRGGFTLIEVLIVVVIMAVLAATIIPQFSSSTQDAKESQLSFNMHTLRSQIEIYKVHHVGSYPVITGSDLPQLTSETNAKGVVNTGASDPDTYPYGPYVDSELPSNPFSDLNTVAAGTGAAGDGSSGWQYNASTGGIWPNHSGWTP
ncbi:MAG TPA: type II secretion system protein [Thermoguttaceae bacterium]|nr:type II secretion system protein [Thermoguttaceae bacterium]